MDSQQLCSPSSSPEAPQINETSVNPGASFKANPTIFPLLTACRWARCGGWGCLEGWCSPRRRGGCGSILIQATILSYLDSCNSLLRGLPALNHITQQSILTTANVCYICHFFSESHVNSFPLAFRVIAKAFAIFYKVLHDLAPHCLSDLIYCSVLLPRTPQFYFCYRFMLFTVSEMFLQIST